MTTSTQSPDVTPDLNAINDWTQSDYNLLSVELFQSMTDTQVQALLHPEWVPGTVLAQLSAVTLNKLTPLQFQALTSTQLNQIPTTTLTGLDNAHIAALTAAQVGAFTHITSLSNAQFGLLNLNAVSASTMSGWGQSSWSGLTATQMSQLTNDQINAMQNATWLPLSAVSGIQPSQVLVFTKNYGRFNADWFNQMRLDSFQVLDSTRLAQISATIWSQIDNAHITGLTPTQIGTVVQHASLTNAQYALLDLTAVSPAAMSSWGQSSWAGLTATQMSLLTTDQINAMQSATWLPLSAVSGLQPSQVLVFTSNYGRFDGAWFNQMRLDSFQILDNGRLSQISAATWAQIDVAHFSALNAAQIGVIKLDFSTVSADWMSSLSPATFQGLTTTQLGQLTAAATAGISDTCLSTITPAQLAALPDLSQLSGDQFSLLNISAMSNAQIAAWTPDQYATLTAAEFNTLTTAQVGAMINPAALPLAIVSILAVSQVNAINIDFSKLPDNWLNSLSTTALQGLTPYQFSHLSSLTPAEVNNITSLAALSSAQFSQLNLKGMTASQIASWSMQNNYPGLTAQQISSLSNAQIEAMQHPDWMPASAAGGFTADKLANISISLSWFSTDWLNNLSLGVFQSMTTTQLNQISASKLSGMDNAHLVALSATQVAAMTNLGSLACAKFGVLNISALSASQLAVLTLSQYQGLTQAQMSSLSATQIQALAHPEWLAPTLINNISLSQIGAMTAAQITSMSPGAIASLDAAHLAVWPGDVSAFTPEELLAVGPRLTNTQLNSLTDSQRSMLATSNSTAQALINSLSDASLQNIMQSVESGSGTLFSFSAIESVMKKLSAGMNGTLSASQYADLKSYTQDIGQVCGVNTAIYSLVNGMINSGNGASVYWTSPSDGSLTPISSLNVGSSTTQFNQLIANWFDGTNEPASYSASHVDGRPLFANGTPTISDISQGQIGDCDVLSSLQAAVDADPNFIKSMFVQNANNTYSVRFFNNGVADWVTVDSNVVSWGASVGTSSWVAIAERASMDFETTYMNNVHTNNKFREVTGDTTTSFSASNTTEDTWNTSDFDILKTAVLNGEPAQLSSWVNSTNATTGQTNFVAGHAFAIIGFDTSTNDFILTNPWGAYRNDNVQGTFEASMDEMWQGGHSSTGIQIGNSSEANAAAGQLVTAMASLTPPFSASSSTAVSQTAAANNALLVTAHA